MKYRVFGFLAILAIAGCQQETPVKEESPQTAVEKTEPANDKAADDTASQRLNSADGQSAGAHRADDGHNHAHPPSEPFTQVEPQYECEQAVVIEFFAYQCPHCYNLEPFAQEWKKANADKVKFISVPTHLGRNEFGSMLLVHHAAVQLDMIDQVQPALFKRLHEDKQLFASADEAADFLASLGADRDVALGLLNDQEKMTDLINKDFEMLSKYKITSVPRLLVNHQYMTDISGAGGREAVFPMVEELLKKESACKTNS